VTVRYGLRIPDVVEGLRAAVREAVLRHTGIVASEVSVTVTDVHGLPDQPGRPPGGPLGRPEELR
jgi:uncharacterized alkaline shock family protein YloU